MLWRLIFLMRSTSRRSMSECAPEVLIVSYSGRALAACAYSGGWRRFAVVDMFGDADTLAISARCATARAGQVGFMPSALLASADDVDPGHCASVVYGSGFDHAPELLEALCKTRPLLGNDANVLRVTKSPLQFSALLDSLAISHPETRSERPACPSGWLSKQAGAAGGGHVRWLSDAEDTSDPNLTYYQRHVRGSSVSVTALGDGRRHQLVGFCLQSCVGEESPQPFAYLGAVTLEANALSNTVRAGIDAAAAKLVDALELRGAFTLDLIVDQDRWWLVELNPRPGATLELHDADADLFCRHVRAAQGALAEQKNRSVPRKARGHRIVYAAKDVTVPSNVSWPNWVTDRPHSGTEVRRHEPVCTVHADAHTSRLAHAGVRARWREMRQALSTWELH